MQLLVESLRLGTPIALGAMAGLWCERSGVVNIGIEGMMLAGAGVGFTVYAVLGDAPGHRVALDRRSRAAVLTGGLVAALHALVTVTSASTRSSPVSSSTCSPSASRASCDRR